ncbi:S26 family signal peptidase (plasmid) [Streptomyces sp. NBC_00053]|nr:MULTISPECIES: S26 family signal peptidase [unclassified Streptomyces]MCX5106877.1 S26 family signal peptidase [Streptomyces sp. NBC_00439]MCX5505985.1 S26 family signal peptidase [Streptomyces sp. NBC_00052]MCX4400013.1 S26 family signal peptidase [Streptomyces sp. NBC_01767]MCX5554015.1 S26 family signal peptidase [Streptomyces sp. NBC_00051]MCX5554361.1 S26 family signal peptidase [Streptomyces sp. NBC_00051]
MPSRKELDELATSWPSGKPPSPGSQLGRLTVRLTALLGRHLLLVTVRGRSMEPTYYERDRVLVVRGTTALRNRVIVIAAPREEGGFFIKRVLATPGEPVPRDRVPALAHVPERQVPSGKLVLVGDNLTQSLDSRQVGYFSGSGVLGRVVLRVFRHPARLDVDPE